MIGDAINRTVASASPDALGAAGRDSDYFATKAHHLALANRILGALRTGGTLVLVTRDPPAGPPRLSEALRNAADSRHAVIDIRCGPQLTSDALSRAGSVVTTLPASGGASAVSEPAGPAVTLFVFDDVDQLSEFQIKEIFEFTRQDTGKGTAAVLLASSGFLTRLERPSLQFLKDGLAARFGFEDIGQYEGIEFLYHQLAASPSSQARGIPRGVFRSLGAYGVLLIIGIAAFWFIQNFSLVEETPPSSATANSLKREALPLPPTASGVNSAPATQSTPLFSGVPSNAATSQSTGLPEMTSPEPATASAPNSAVARAPPSSAAGPDPAQPARALEPTPPAALLSPTETLPKQRPPQSETAALVARGDSFLSVGDIVSARLFYEHAAEAGDGAAALRLGATFDPDFLGKAGVRGVIGDTAQALSWYRRARDLGNPAAAERLKDLAESNSPTR